MPMLKKLKNFVDLVRNLTPYQTTRRTYVLSGVFSPLTSAEAGEKSSQWLWKENCVNTGVKKPGNTCSSQTLMM